MMDPDEAEGSHVMEVIHLSRGKPPRILVKKDSLGSAKQISVDPISLYLKESSNQQQSPKIDLLIPRNKLVSQSLPNSALSSPGICFSSDMSVKKCKHQSQPLFLSVMSPQDCVTLANVDRLHDIHLLKSKSCGEGRASEPPESFGLYLSEVDIVKHQESQNCSDTDYLKDGNRPDVAENMDMDEKFKCKALCLYLPGFNNKAKLVKSRRQGSDMAGSKELETGCVVSKRVSLEKFECLSWNSSNLMNEDEEEDDDASNFFDLPLELIRCSSGNDTHTPVTTAFVFDKEPKPLVKNNSRLISSARKSNESVGHVCFSTSHPASPTFCITPCRHLCKVRGDFDSFLEAQSG